MRSLLHGMEAGPRRACVPAGSFPDLLGALAVLRVGDDHHVGRQAVGEGADSRAVPQALGWPVSEKGLLPGSEILPTSRCTL
jgi:hypothetical protein